MIGTLRFNKIVATLGPAISQKGILKQIDKYVDIYRINLSHAELIKTRELIKTIRSINSKKVFMLDTKGPEIRTTNKELTVKKGDIVKVYNEPKDGEISLEYQFFKNIPVDVEISFNDKKVIAIVKKNNGDFLEIEIVQGGTIGYNKTVNFIGYEIELDFLTEKDLKDIKFLVEENIGLIAVSFVKNAENIERLREYVKNEYDYDVKIIAKIETKSAVENVDEIIKASDGIMIARGDLGANMDLIHIPKIQQEIIEKCNMNGKPVILATQVMSSMVNSPMPTRAEVDEIAFNIQNGVDALMLSDETAIGNYPFETLKMLNDVILQYQNEVEKIKFLWEGLNYYVDDENLITDYILYSAKKIASKLKVKFIVTPTETGYTPGKISALKPNVPIIAFTEKDNTFKYCNLMFGVYPHKVGTGQVSYDVLRKIIGEMLQKEFRGKIKGEDKILIIHSTVKQNVANMINGLEVVKFKDL